MKTKAFIKLTCKEATLLLTKRDEENMGLWLGFRLKIHLQACPPCKRFQKQNLILDRSIKSYKKQEFDLPIRKLSNETKTAFQQKIDTESTSRS